jgi:hypothetical protein
MKLSNVYVGDEPVGAGYPTFKAAQAAARKIAAEYGALPLDFRPITHNPHDLLDSIELMPPARGVGEAE